MLRFINRVALVGLLLAGVPAAQAFVTIGPGSEPYQVPDLGYMVPGRGDIGAPKNIGEDYRRNTPVLYYAFDENFLDYFGSNGVWAVEQAFTILNNLTNVSSYSADLSEIPLEATRFNQQAGALNLIDLKSAVLGVMVEQLGLANPIRYTWGLHDRVVGANCPIGNQYLVVRRNLAMVPSNLDQVQYSSYVNNVLFSYYVHDYCGNPVPFGEPLSEAISFAVDVPENALRFAPVASFALGTLVPGQFYTGLTRDDVAGLRYLLRSGHVHWEDVPATSTVFVTNIASGLQLLLTSNLTLLASQALTNNAAALQALYPGLNIVATTNYYTNVWVTNFTPYFYNDPSAPWGTPAQLKFKTTRTLTVQTYYHHTFGNVVTFQYINGQWTVVPLPDITTHLGGQVVTVQTTSVTNFYSDAWGTPPHTNTSSFTYATNAVSGEYFILASNLCSIAIAGLQATMVSTVTNSVTATNNATAGTTNTQSFTQTSFYYVTNHVFTYYPVDCVTNEPSLRRGVEKITFVKTAYDSLLGKFYAPQTNYFSMTVVTNSTNWVQTYQRVVTAPDFLFTATDALPGPAAPLRWFDVARSINFSSNNILPGLAGPGTIDPITTITFNKSGPVLYNTVTNNFYSLDEKTAFQDVLWASYDDSTNAPVVYPNGTSIAAIESQMLMQVTSTTLPPGKVGAAYSTQLTGTGGSGPPYTWSLAPDSPALPPGLALTLDGKLSGTPTASGISYFYVQMTGPTGGFTVWQVILTVLP
jgi:hypothetical protein